MANKNRPKRARKKVPWWQPVWALVDRKHILNYLIVAALAGAGFGIKHLYDSYQERKSHRAEISEEIIQYRIPAAQRRVDQASLAKKYLDGTDPRQSPHRPGVPLRMLISEWKSEGGGNIAPELIQLASEPAPTSEQVRRLIDLLKHAFADDIVPEPSPLESAKDESTPDGGGDLSPAKSD